MPLKKSSSKAAFKQNVREMMRSGKFTQKQALAAAFRQKRQAAARKGKRKKGK
jgi:hypothetical protein